MPFSRSNMLYDDGIYYSWSAAASGDNPFVRTGIEHILMRELVGHALPIINGKMNGNAVTNENVVRAQLNITLRKPEIDHLESNFGN